MEYNFEKTAKEFLQKANARMKIELTGIAFGFPGDRTDKYPHRQYNVTLYNDTSKKKYKFPFYGSYSDFLEGKDPTNYDILACLEKDSCDSIEEFIGEYGYEPADEEEWEMVEETYSDCQRQYESLLDLFGEELMEELREIN